MDNIFFITDKFRRMVEESGLSLDCLKKENIRDHFSADIIYDIDYMTTKAREDGGILANYGFGFKDSEQVQEATNRLIVPKPDLEKLTNAYEHYSSPLTAYCPDDKTIILWMPENVESDKLISNSMFKVNLKEILKAMARVLSSKVLLKSSQIELAILRG